MKKKKYYTYFSLFKFKPAYNWKFEWKAETPINSLEKILMLVTYLHTYTNVFAGYCNVNILSRV